MKPPIRFGPRGAIALLRRQTAGKNLEHDVGRFTASSATLAGTR